MGIKNLTKFIKDKYPKVVKDIHIKQFEGRKVAVDTSLFLCKFKSMYGDYWLSSFVKMCITLRKFNVHPIFIYDTGAPPDKQKERQERQEAREKTNERIFDLKESVEVYENTGEVQPILEKFVEKHNYKTLLTNKIVVSQVEEKIEKMEQQLFHIEKSDFEKTRELFEILNIPYAFAPLEAETMCADLFKRGLVDAVFSEDSDVLAYGADFITRFNSTSGCAKMIIMSELLKETGLNQREFTDFCIMCGCDYNDNIPKIGVVNSFKLIKEHSRIEKVLTIVKDDNDVLRYKRCRELFFEYDQHPLNKVPFSGIPDFDKLSLFYFENNLTSYNLEEFKKSFMCEIIIE